MRAITCVGMMVEGVVYKLQRLADQADRKGKGKAKPEEVAVTDRFSFSYLICD